MLMHYGTTWAVLAGLTCLSAPAFAHDLWVQPSRFSVPAGAPVAVRIRVGHDEDVKELPRKPDRIVRFAAVRGKRSKAITGAPGSRPAGRVVLDAPGLYTVVYQSNHAYIELAAEKFESYLRHEGLDGIIADRKRRDESDGPGKESYARYAKALVEVGAGAAYAAHDLGLPLEVTAMSRPKLGQPTRFRVRFRGAPLAGARVELMRTEDLTDKKGGTTDEAGEVELRPEAPGSYLVAITHMVRAPKALKGDWESFWGSLAFEVVALEE